jgi:hypothetical protein
MKMSSPIYSNKHRWLRHLHALWLVLLGVACHSNGPNSGGDIIVRYRQHTLSRAEIDHFVPPGATGEDSTRYAERYIEEWIQGHAIAEYARSRIDGLNKELSYKVKQYEQDLIAHAFNQYLTKNNQDQLQVSDADVLDYYDKNPDKFISETNYYQFRYVRANEYSNQQVVPLMRSNDPDRLAELVEWARENALDYRLDSSYVQDQELDRIGEGFYYGNIRRVSKSTAYPYQLRKDGKSYYNYFRMLNVIEPGDRLPLRICREQIRSILINQKKNSLIEREQAALVEQARAAKKIMR